MQKHSSGEEDPLGNYIEKHQIRGWRGVSAATLLGRGSRKRNVLFTDIGITVAVVVTDGVATTASISVSITAAVAATLVLVASRPCRCSAKLFV